MSFGEGRDAVMRGNAGCRNLIYCVSITTASFSVGTKKTFLPLSLSRMKSAPRHKMSDYISGRPEHGRGHTETAFERGVETHRVGIADDFCDLLDRQRCVEQQLPRQPHPALEEIGVDRHAEFMLEGGFQIILIGADSQSEFVQRQRRLDIRHYYISCFVDFAEQAGCAVYLFKSFGTI